MSAKTMATALQIPGLSALQKLLLVFLGDKEDAQGLGRSHWSIPRIAFYLDFSERAVKLALRALAAEGLITITPRPRQSNVYTMTILPGATQRERRHPENRPPREGERNVGQGGTERQSEGEKDDESRGNETHPESPIKNPSEESPNEPHAHASARDDAAFDGGPDIIATANARPIPDIEDAFPFLSEAPPPKPKPRRVGKSIADYAAEFAAAFWPRYPRKVAKGRAEKAFIHWRKAGITLEQIMAAMDGYEWPTRLRFTPHASTWLNDRPWETVGEQEPEFDPALRAAGLTPERAMAVLRKAEEHRREQSSIMLAIPGGRDAA